MGGQGDMYVLIFKIFFPYWHVQVAEWSAFPAGKREDWSSFHANVKNFSRGIKCLEERLVKSFELDLNFKLS